MKKFKEDNINFFKHDIFNSFIDLLKKKESTELFNKIKKYHPSEIASYIQTLDRRHRKELIKILSNNFDSRILVELEPSFLGKIIKDFDINIISKAIKEMDSDDAASIINVLDENTKLKVFTKISPNYRLLIEDNLSYKENTAGRLMQAEIVKIPINFNVGQTIDFLRKKRQKLPKVFYDVFIVDKDNILIGQIPLSKIVSSYRSKEISKLIHVNQESIHFSIDQEEVADIFRRKNLTSMAVVNDQMELLGVINIEDIVDVIDTEAEEDILKLAGVGEQSFYSAIFSVTRARFTWLFLNLLAAFIAAYVIKNFENTIEEFALLAAIMPLIASMGGCSGTQSLTTAVRAIAMKKLTWSNAFRSTVKEVLVGFINGIIFSVVAFLITFTWFGDLKLSYIISIALLLNLIFGSFFGTFIPIILTRYGIDPAFASGTFVITFTDIFGFLLFLTLATFYLV